MVSEMEYIVSEGVSIGGNFTFESFGCNQTIDLSGITAIGGDCCCDISEVDDDLGESCHNKDIGNLGNESCYFMFKGPAVTDCTCPSDDPSSGINFAQQLALPGIVALWLFSKIVQGV